MQRNTQVSDKSDFENICAEIEVSNREKEMHTYKGALNIPRGKEHYSSDFREKVQ